MIRHAASITSLLAVVAASFPGPARAQGTGEWLTYQHDFQRTGRADGAGAIVDPAVAWSIPLGGMLSVPQFAVADLDGDGEREVVGLKGSRVQALRSDGTLLWTTPTSGHLAVYGVWDVDGDGSPEVLVNSDREARLLSASTGQILGRIPSVASATATFVPGVQGGLIVVGADGSLIAYDPAQDLATPPSVWTATLSMRQPPIAGDVDGDGGLDLVVPLSSGYALLDPSTGAQKGATLDLGGCFPQRFQLADVDGQPGWEIVALDASSTSSPNAGIRVMRWGTGKLEVLWASLRAAPAVHDYDVAGPIGMVADLDGDGSREVVYSEWDRVAASWTTRIVDAATGSPVSSITGRTAHAIADIDGDGKLEIVTKATSRADGGPAYATLEAFDVDSRAGGAVAKAWSLTESRLLSHALPPSDQAAVGLERPVVDDLDPAVAGLELVVSRDPTGAGEGTELLILHGGDGTTARQLPLGTSGGLSVLWFGAKLSGSAAVGDLLLLGRDGVVRVQRRDGTSRGELALGSYAPAVTVARSDLGRNRIFVNDSRGVLRWLDGGQLDSTGTPRAVLASPQAWDPTLAGTPLHPYDPVFTVPGATPVFVSTVWDSVRFCLVGRDSSGLELWRSPLAIAASPRFPGGYVTDVTGDGQPELVLGISTYAGTTLAVYDPQDGGLIRSTPVETIAAGASSGLVGALADVDADGTLDLTYMALDYGLLSVDLRAAPMSKLWGPAGTSLLSGGTVGAAPLAAPGQQDLFVVGGNQTSGPYYRVGLDGSVIKTWDGGTPGSEGSDTNAAALVADGTGTYDLVVTGMAAPALSRVVRLDGNELTPVWTRFVADGAVGDTAPVAPVALHGPIEVDLNGDGAEEVVFGADDGYLYALRADTGARVFALQLGAVPRQVVAANIDGDAPLELLVTLDDGRLLAIDDRAAVPPPEEPPPGSDGCGCRSGSASSLGWVAAMLLGGLPTRRRRWCRSGPASRA